MLKLKYLIENFDLAKNCIQHWEHDPETLTETLGWFRISSNAVYPFHQKGRLCFLRLCPAEGKPLSEVESEIAVIQWLRDQGFSAMAPVPMKNGRFCDRLDTPWGSYVASCFHQVDGQPLEDCPATSQLLEGYGRCLGQLHRMLEHCPCGHQRSGHEEWLAKAEQQLTACHAPDSMKACLQDLRCQLAQLPRNSGNYSLIHYDFEPDNVFFHPQTGQFSVIDFDDMIHCWHGLDIVRALDGLDDLPQGDEPLSKHEREQLFLTGYRSQHPFSATDEAALPLMRRLVQLTEYAGLLHVLSEEVLNPPEWMMQLRCRLTGKLRWLENQLLG